MLSGKLPPAAAPLPEPVSRDAARDTARRRAADGGVPDVLGVRSSHAVAHHAPLRTRALAHHGHHAHHGTAQTDRVIATVARNIVVGGDEGAPSEIQELDQTVFFVSRGGAVDDCVDTDDDPTEVQDGEADLAAGDAGAAGSAAESPQVEPADARPAGSETSDASGLSVDDVKSTRGREGLSTGGANADGSGGGGGSAGTSAAIVDAIDPAAGASPVTTVGLDTASIARVERAAPMRPARRRGVPQEHATARLIGIGVAAAALVLVLVLLLSSLSSPPPALRDDESQDSEQAR